MPCVGKFAEHFAFVFGVGLHIMEHNEDVERSQATRKSRSASRIAGVAVSALLLLSCLPGCAFWHDFTNYFNVLYLALWHLDQYEEELTLTPENTTSAVATLSHRWLDEELQSRRTAMEAGLLSKITPSFQKSQTVGKSANVVHLDSAIILGSKILADKKSTKYIEDALFVVGKAQFYKNDFPGSKRKFLELLYRYPNTKYGTEVQLLLARSTLSGKQLDTAETALNRARDFAEKSGDKQQIGEVHRAMAEYLYARNPDTLTAISAELRAAGALITGNDGARLAFEEGTVEYLNRDWAAAEQSFRRAYSSTSDAAVEGEAHMAHAITLRRLKRYDETKAEFALVIAKAKYSNSHPAAKYELAYTDDIIARENVGGDLRSNEFQTKYARSIKRNYWIVDTTFARTSQPIVSRAKYRIAEMYREMGQFDSAARYAMTLIGTKDFNSTSMNEFVSERMRSLSRFASYTEEATRMDSVDLLVRDLRAGKFRSKSGNAEMYLEAAQSVMGDRFNPMRPPGTEDSIKIAELVPKLKPHTAALSLTINDTSRFLDSIHFRASNAHFDLGRAFETFGEYPSAEREYKTALAFRFIIPDSAKDVLKAQVYYAYVQLANRDSNIVLRDSLLENLVTYYGQTVFAQQARLLYGKKLDPNSRPESAYRGAYTMMKQGGVESARSAFEELVRGYPHDDAAPRSLYAVGMGYEDLGKYDSAVRFYRRVLVEYPYSAYADALRPRLADGVGFKAPPRSGARRVLTPDPKSDDEKAKEELDRARQLQEDQMKQTQDGRPQLPGQQPGQMPTVQPMDEPVMPAVKFDTPPVTPMRGGPKNTPSVTDSTQRKKITPTPPDPTPVK